MRMTRSRSGESVPPKLYAAPTCLAWLCDELVELGHDVTLFASGNSQTRAKLVPVWPYAFRLGRPRTDPVAVQAVLLETMAKRAAEFDVVHCHVDWLALPLLTRSGVPFLTTMHGRLDSTGLRMSCATFRAPFVSTAQPAPAATSRQLAGPVYHGLPSDSLHPRFEPGSYLAFLGRLTKEKGPEEAMRIARDAGMPLRIAAKVPKGERGYFKEQLEPKIDGRDIQLTGEVNDKTKEEFLANAAALVFPTTGPSRSAWSDRGHGCGTPVIAYRHGGAGSDRRRRHGFVAQRRGSRARRQASRRDQTGAQVRACSSGASLPAEWPASMSHSTKIWCAAAPLIGRDGGGVGGR